MLFCPFLLYSKVTPSYRNTLFYTTHLSACSTRMFKLCSLETTYSRLLSFGFLTQLFDIVWILVGVLGPFSFHVPGDVIVFVFRLPAVSSICPSYAIVSYSFIPTFVFGTHQYTIFWFSISSPLAYFVTHFSVILLVGYPRNFEMYLLITQIYFKQVLLSCLRRCKNGVNVLTPFLPFHLCYYLCSSTTLL